MTRWAVLLFLVLGCCAPTAAFADEFDPFPPDSVQRAHEKVTPALCLISYSMEVRNRGTGEVTRRPGFAMGVIVSSDGLILSHGHLLVDDRRPTNLQARIGSGTDLKEYPLVMLSKPDDVNLTFFRVETDEDVTFPHVEFDSSAELGLGERVMVFGLLGEPFDHSRTIQIRRVGAILETPRLTYSLDESISFGFVAGPVLNRAGDPIGVIGFDLSRGEGGEVYTRSGHPLIYQAALFQPYVESPPDEDNEREWAWLGVFSQPLTDDLATYWELEKTGGIVVSTVVPGSPAESSGLLAGDIIKKFNGVSLEAKTDREVTGFTRLVRESPIGEELGVDIIRDGDPLTIELALSERPVAAREAELFEDEVLGLTVRELTTDSRLRLNLSDDVQGVLVRGVRSGSPAALAGLRPNFIILGFGRRPVRNLTEYRQLLELMKQVQPDEATLFCRVGANTAFFRLRPRWEQDE